MTFHPQIIEKNSKKEFVVLPYEEWVELQSVLEDAQDLIDLREAKRDESSSATVALRDVKRELDL